MAEPEIKYDVDGATGKTVAIIVGGNGEIQGRTERYSSQSNARRGLADLHRTMLALVSSGQINMDRAADMHEELAEADAEAEQAETGGQPPPPYIPPPPEPEDPHTGHASPPPEEDPPSAA